ncbi:LOW QUALITY PROTEIN: hypothetical protein U9M48_027732 [Paspalum notatum var. saurae]|uniref:Retrotransposon gag domain-containing protein n=1 Tax=Paspalum notatum var. saurae TaxID=547442 RepID=A0AAQ3TZE9_PASNO
MTGSVQWSDSLTLHSAMIKRGSSGQLRGAALDWWESYIPQDRECFTWAQFCERFRSHHVHAGIMKMKKKEFLSLK